MHYVAFLHSQLHLNAFYAYCISKISNKEELSGVIYLKGDEKRGLLITEKDCDFLGKCQIRRIITDNHKKESIIQKTVRNIKELKAFDKLVKTQKNGTVLNVFFPGDAFFCSPELLYSLKKEFTADSIKLIYLEEGIGSYIRSKKRWQERGTESIGRLHALSIKAQVRVKNHIGKDRVLNELERTNSIEYFYILKRDGNTFVSDDTVCSAVLEVINKRSEKLVDSREYSRVVLINSQPFMEEIGCEKDIECYKKIKQICEKYDLKLVIKPHPKEKRLDRYTSVGLDVDESDKTVPQEMILAASTVKPALMIGFFSTSLILANLFFNIPVMCIGKLEDFEMIAGYGEDIKSFIGSFANYLIIPETYEKVERAIIELKKEM